MVFTAVADEGKRPSLRIVAPDEAPRETPVAPVAPVPPPAEPASTVPTAEAVALDKAVDAADASDLLTAGYLTSVGCYLSEAACDFFNQAVAHAPPNTFRNDVAPGMKSAQATRAWLGTHLAEVKKIVGAKEKPAQYERSKDLKQGVVLSANELKRALAATKTAGLWFDERYATVLKNALGDIQSVEGFREQMRVPQVVEAAPLLAPTTKDDLYILGLDVLGGVPNA